MATRFTDGKKTVDITMHAWQGTNWGPDFFGEFFSADLPYDGETSTFTVDNVDYLKDVLDDWKAWDGDFRDGGAGPDDEYEYNVVIEDEEKIEAIARTRYSFGWRRADACEAYVLELKELDGLSNEEIELFLKKLGQVEFNENFDAEAASLYDGGWRPEDRDRIIIEYELTPEQADRLCEKFKEFDE